MSYFPLFIDLENQECLVLGGGNVAYRKVCALLSFGAKVTVIAAELIAEFAQLCEVRQIVRSVKVQALEELELDQYTLVIAATSDEVLNHEISLICREKHIPINVVDQKEDCSFIFPSFFQKGDLTVGVTSAGKSPYYASLMRKRYEASTPAMTEALLEQMGEVRKGLKEQIEDTVLRGRILKEMIDFGIEKCDVLSKEEMNRIIKKVEQDERNDESRD